MFMECYVNKRQACVPCLVFDVFIKNACISINWVKWILIPNDQFIFVDFFIWFFFLSFFSAHSVLDIILIHSAFVACFKYKIITQSKSYQIHYRRPQHCLSNAILIYAYAIIISFEFSAYLVLFSSVYTKGKEVTTIYNFVVHMTSCPSYSWYIFNIQFSLSKPLFINWKCGRKFFDLFSIKFSSPSTVSHPWWLVNVRKNQK